MKKHFTSALHLVKGPADASSGPAEQLQFLRTEISRLETQLNTKLHEDGRNTLASNSHGHGLRLIPTERTRRTTKIAELRALIPSLTLQTFPDELLVEIFTWVTPYRFRVPRRFGPEKSSRFPSSLIRPLLKDKEGVQTKKSPWVLSHVCRRWRKIALSTPKLWSVLPIVDLPVDSAEGTKAEMNELLQLQLSRLQATGKMSVYSEACDYISLSNEPASIDILKPYVEQWEDVRLLLAGYAVPNFSDVQGRFTSLRSIHIWKPVGFSRPDRYSGALLDLFSSAPLLEELTLMVEELIPNQGRLRLPPTLKRYHGYYPGSAASLQLLSSIPQVLECTFTVYYRLSVLDTLAPATHPGVVTLPALTTFGFVNWFQEAEGDAVLNYLVLPALSTLFVSAMPRPRGTIPYSSIINLLRRSRCSLKTLKLCTLSNWPESNVAAEFFSAIPDLESLYFHNRFEKNDALKYLMDLLQDQPSLLPRLRKLELMGQSNPVLDFIQLQGLVSMRSAGTASFDPDSIPSEKSGVGCLERLTLPKYMLTWLAKAQIESGLYQTNSDEYRQLVLLEHTISKLIRISPYCRNRADRLKFNGAMQAVWDGKDAFQIENILGTQLHLAIMKIASRGTVSPSQFEAPWLSKCEKIIEGWKARVWVYVQEPRWNPHSDRFHWTVGSGYDSDAASIFWEVPTSQRHFGFVPAHIFPDHSDPFKSAKWLPPWEHDDWQVIAKDSKKSRRWWNLRRR